MTDTTELPQQEPALSSEQLFLRSVAQVSVCVFLSVLLLYGICIAGVVLKEPDICFMLGGGRWIVEHGCLPQSDPFSYTTHYHPYRYVIEKWLAQVIFYGIESSLGLCALILFGGAVHAITYVIIPLRIAYLCGVRGGAAIWMSTLTLLASLSHLALRAEIFSGLFCAIWLELMVRINIATRGNTKIRWGSIGLMVVLTCLWSNMHTLFMLAVLIPGFYSVCAGVEKLVPGLKNTPFNWTAPIATVACALASLVNPYGINLWLSIPNVFGAFTATNNEMQPISIANVANPLFFPFYLMMFLSLRTFLSALKRPLKQGEIYFRGLLLLGIFAGIKTIRSIPLAGLFLLNSHAQATGASRNAADELTAMETCFGIIANPFSIKWQAKCLSAVCLGAYICTFSVIPDVPQVSAAFKPPFKAIKYIQNHRPPGNLLNDPHFGAVMIYKMHENPLVFIDPRYNLYGNALLQDYWHMVNCDANYNQLLEHYNIDWVFLAPRENLSKMLAKSPKWQLLYSDNTSVIFSRRLAANQVVQ